MAEPRLSPERAMQAALRLAAAGDGTTWPNPSVGAVVFRGGKNFGTGKDAPRRGRPRGNRGPCIGTSAGGRSRPARRFPRGHPRTVCCPGTHWSLRGSPGGGRLASSLHRLPRLEPESEWARSSSTSPERYRGRDAFQSSMPASTPRISLRPGAWSPFREPETCCNARWTNCHGPG